MHNNGRLVAFEHHEFVFVQNVTVWLLKLFSIDICVVAV